MPPLDASSRLSLLDPEPFSRVDEASLAGTLAFAFATGDVGDELERVVERMALAPTQWEKSEFARDVFLVEFVQRCLPVVACGKVYPTGRAFVARVLGEPPRDPAVALFRQAIFRELIDTPGLREATERLYTLVAEVRELLTRATGLRLDANRLRLDILRSLAQTVDLAAEAFTAATSGLGRIGAWGARVRGTAAFARLRDLIAYEGNACELDLTVRLGIDGKLRDLTVVRRREPEDNPFHVGPFRRFLQKAGLLFRGHRFTEETLLARMIDDVFSGIEALVLPLFPLLGDLEFYLAGMAFRDGAHRAGLTVSLPAFGEPGEGHALTALFNPLLLTEGGGAVPCDLRTARADTLAILTGPNSGGKTRLLQSIALTQMLAQSGMFVPASDARVPFCSALFVSILDRANVDQKEGRLGTELFRIRRLFEQLDPDSLVIVDELCSGTNPEEGEEIFRMVVKLLRELRPTAFITTHFLAFARRLADEDEDGALAFLQVELADERPTYRFVPGVATTSLAQQTAARLGVTETSLRALLRARELAAKAPAPAPALEADAGEDAPSSAR